MSIASIARLAFTVARAQGHSPLVGLWWAILDLRASAYEAAYVAGLPPLLLADVGELPDLMGRAEYALKTPWYIFLREGAIGDLLWQINDEAARDWQ